MRKKTALGSIGKQFKEKFAYELESSIYCVAALFNVLSLEEWVTCDEGKKVFEHALKSIQLVYDMRHCQRTEFDKARNTR